MFTNSIPQVFLRKIHKQTGFSLIEVMVTLVILSFGLLGVSGLLVKGISNASASESMAKASLLVASISDRIRANSEVAMKPSNEYIRKYEDHMPDESDKSIALTDVRGWLESLRDQLPQGDGEIISNSSMPSKVTIGVRWSNCLGTLNDEDKNSCKKNSADSFKSITYELRL